MPSKVGRLHRASSLADAGSQAFELSSWIAAGRVEALNTIKAAQPIQGTPVGAPGLAPGDFLKRANST